MVTQLEIGFGDTSFGVITLTDSTFTYTGQTAVLEKMVTLIQRKKAGVTPGGVMDALLAGNRSLSWAKPVGGKKYNENHDERGLFSSGPGASLGSMGVLTTEQQGIINAAMTARGLSQKIGVDAATTLMEHAITSGHFAEDGKWYETASAQVNALAAQKGLTPEATAGVVAALSPQTRWNEQLPDGTEIYPNLEGAQTIINAYQANGVIDINSQLVEGLSKYDDATHLSELLGQQIHLNDLTPLQAAYILSPGIRSYPANTAKALSILGGQSPDDVLGGSKVRSFFSNIMWPQDSSGVTIDTWMLRVLTGNNLQTDKKELYKYISSPTSKGLKGIGGYPYFAEMINTVAKNYNILPSVAQAIIWTQSRREGGDVRINESR